MIYLTLSFFTRIEKIFLYKFYIKNTVITVLKNVIFIVKGKINWMTI